MISFNNYYNRLQGVRKITHFEKKHCNAILALINGTRHNLNDQDIVLSFNLG